MALPIQAGFPYEEPSDLERIRAARPTGPRTLPRPADDALADKMLGAWLGRAAGCQLGKPVEGWHKNKIEIYLRAAGAYPLDDYIPWIDPMPEEAQIRPGHRISTKGNFSQMARDDDIDYTIFGLHILEKHGLDFQTEHVGAGWLRLLPYHMVYTAERVAYRNLVNELPLPEVAVYRNPFREWIGAQIRADGWAYAAAALPEVAAEFAWRDASLSHVKNGIYGEMWAAAMIAAAFAEPPGVPAHDQIKRVIETGLSEIPANCRLAEALHKLMAWRGETDDWRAAWDRIDAEYGHYHWVHTINNALLVALGLLYGEGDYTRSISIAVMGGWDTDCNGATAGSVMGAILGAANLPARWIDPLGDTTGSALIGFDGSKFSDLARRSFEMSRQVTARWG
ncbi:MAG: ADP-ribosylglycohydrolase family protein [Anaerolineae bacterium]|nr:ADP-ribosylglycohydrolase family protein [Anaerolineae bacterium]